MLTRILTGLVGVPIVVWPKIKAIMFFIFRPVL